MKKHALATLIICLATLALTGCSQSQTPKKVALFNGQDLDGWITYLDAPNMDPAHVWSITDDVIHCKGKPNGYLRTTESYSDYKLHVEWRWPEEPTNSGVLLHSTGEDKIWPLCVEAQLMHENAGDFVTIQKGSAITVNGQQHEPPEDKIYKIIPKQVKSSENPPGQWNSYDIICQGNTISLTVNGVFQNLATESKLSSGSICLQSEGSPIEFRNIYIEPLN